MSFTYTPADGVTGGYIADGMTFVLQNAGTGALGGGGGSLGYSPNVSPSVGVGFNIYTYASPQQGLVFVQNGNIGTPMATGSVNVASLDPIQVTLNYDGSNNLVTTLEDLNTTATYSTTDSVGSLVSDLGGNTAYLGFTGASGAGAAVQTVDNFNFTSVFTGMPNILPATTALSVSSGTLDLNGASQTVASLSGTGTITNTSSASLAVFVRGRNRHFDFRWYDRRRCRPDLARAHQRGDTNPQRDQQFHRRNSRLGRRIDPHEQRGARRRVELDRRRRLGV